MRKKIGKAIAGVLAVLVCLVLPGINGINAYLADGKTTVNSLSVGSNKIEIEEEFTPPPIDEVKPGKVITKNVKICNTGSVSCYVRVKAVFTDSDMGKWCTVDWNTNDFVYHGSDGYYYYRWKLDPGQTTESLMTQITLSRDIPEAEIKEFSLIVYAESCQSGEYTDYEGAWEYFRRNEP